MTPRTKEQNEEIRLHRLIQIRKAAADVFLHKGPLLEIRDVATQAGLGYGTVYHYYSNKGDLLYDLLWDALDRAGGWIQSTTGIPHVMNANVDSNADFIADTYNESSEIEDSQMGKNETVASTELSPIAISSIRLLQQWSEDHALYLLFKLAGEGFISQPEARSAPLLAAFRREVVTPLAELIETTNYALDVAATSSGNTTEPPYLIERAEMLLAALVGCASLLLRRGKLHAEADNIVRFLKL